MSAAVASAAVASSDGGAPPPPIEFSVYENFPEALARQLLLLSIVLSTGAPAGQEMLLFSSVFFIFWVGSAVVTFNAQLLGGKISFFQSVCVLGYCMFPLNIGSVLCYLWSNWMWRLVVTSVCMFWSTRASVVFISQMIDAKRKILAVYPVVLFYLVISWMILISG